jgi:hypothetical protein
MSQTTDSAAAPAWRIRGHVVLACNCDYGCPCNFNGLPTTGKCEGNWNWLIEEGSFGEVPLEGLSFGLAVNWPGAIHEGGGEAMVVVDESCDERQREALLALVSGRAGGPWKIIATTIGRTHEPLFVPFEVRVDGFASRVQAGDHISLQLEPVRNKVTGAEVHPRAVLPEGFVFREADLAASSTFRVDGPVSFDHTGRYAAAAPFEYQGP